MEPRAGRRSGVARALVVTVVAMLSVAVPHAAFGQQHGEGMLPPGDWTTEQEQYLLDLIARTEAVLPAFADPAQLEALGFIDFGVTAPGGYDHFINWAWIDDEHILDPEHPESLVFQQTWNDVTQQPEYRLVSAMFFLPSQYDMSNIPEDLAWLPGWHNHADVCVNDQGTFAGFPTFTGHCATGRPFDKPPMMHVWIVDNQCGHRFGGIDVGGLHCDVHGHPGHDGDPGHGDDPGHDMGDPGDGMHGGEMPPAAPPAQPVSQEPSFTG